MKQPPAGSQHTRHDVQGEQRNGMKDEKKLEPTEKEIVISLPKDRVECMIVAHRRRVAVPGAAYNHRGKLLEKQKFN